MIKVELTTDTEMFPAGAVLSVDENSAAALIARGDAKLLDDQAPAPAVQSGGARARALNQQATAAAESTNDNDSEAGEDGEDDD
ncbi:hypothetical protein [Tsukamurella hominis]|uniref:hypothetical protein n=1 Tax=Tsukamurella hominis TaxID=1970232 RepID=UPI0039E855F2